MQRRPFDPAIRVIYATILLLSMAYGVALAVLSVHMKEHDVPEMRLAWLATAFASGLAGASIPMGKLVARSSAGRVLVIGLLGYGVSVAAVPFLTSFGGLVVARVFDGIFSVGVWIAAETALLSRAEESRRGEVMSIYAICISVGYVVGPVISRLIVPLYGTDASFVLAGAIAFTAALLAFVGLRREPEARHEAHDRKDDPKEAVSTSAVLWRIKTSCLATFSYGYFQSSVVAYLPLFLIASKGVSRDQTILVPAFFASGMLLFSAWVGRIGDRRGHLRTMRVLGAIGGAMVAGFVVLPTFELMCAAVFVAGATLATISPVSLALQGVVTPPSELSRANALYNVSYALGMLAGPLISGFAFTRYGGGAMLLHLATLWACFVAFTIVFAKDDPQSAGRAREAQAVLR